MTAKPTSPQSQSALDRFQVLEDRIARLIDALDEERRGRASLERQLETTRQAEGRRELSDRALTEARERIHALEEEVARFRKERAAIRSRIQQVMAELAKFRQEQEKQVV